jgi:hypothetical protein
MKESEVHIAGAICRFSDPGNDEENALWVPFEEDVAVGWG